MGRNYRQGRLGEEIKKCISGYLLNGIKDPRLSARIITISAVEVSSDGSYATVYFTPLTLSDEDSREVAKEVLTAFNSAKGLFRTDPAGGVPALAEVRFSVTSHRGCFGSCSFCAIHAHQGRIVQARSHASILREVRLLTRLPGFKRSQ